MDAHRRVAIDAVNDAARSRPPSYARGVRAGAVMFLILGVILLTLSAVVDMLSAPRSVLLGAGIIAVSSAATALVAAQMYRVAPAATAPALAALYLLKVLVLGWFLLFPPPALLLPPPIPRSEGPIPSTPNTARSCSPTTTSASPRAAG